MLIKESSVRARLFCFPYAGGRASIFRAWPDKLPKTVEILPVELPGRGARMMERPLTQIGPLINDIIIRSIGSHLDKPFALFGHSMGALVCFELARYVRSIHGVEPLHLFVSAFRAPQIPKADADVHMLPDNELVEKLRGFRGTPREIIDNPELMKFLMPIIRADFAVCETSTYTPDVPFNCSISAFGGLQDSVVSREELLAWRDQTISSFVLHMVPGEHFFLHTSEAFVLKILSHELTQAVEQMG